MFRSQGIDRIYVILHAIIVEIENDLIIRTGPIAWYEYLCTFKFIFIYMNSEDGIPLGFVYPSLTKPILFAKKLTIFPI